MSTHTDTPAQATAQPTACSRRDFLKLSGAAAALAGLLSLGVSQGAEASSGGANENAQGLLIDLTRCTGCNSCALACKESNGLPNADVVPSRLDSSAYSFVQAVNGQDFLDTQFVKRQCMHCLNPGCASACTVGALRKSADGPVLYDSSKCIGCRYCQYACPFGVPTYDWNNPLGLIHKCEMCKERLAEGEQPACVGACPSGALQFGRRSDLLIQAHARIRSNPERYIEHVYGEHEAGGTSVLYISDVPFADLGFPTLPDQAIPANAVWVMTKTPVVALSVATVATGLHFTMKHRPDPTASDQPFAHEGDHS